MPASAIRVLRVIAGEEQADAELLGRFIDRRDEAAFALLVRRHGAMVYGVCRRLLPTDQDAEDAFQATFLVLAEKARTVVPREAVGNWLYGVARRAALLSRRSIARRRERMGDVPERPASRSDELRAVLDEELSRLPDAYRTVIVLCDLEGRTRREAAAMLGWPEGTVAGRLIRARELLAKRLAPSVSIAAVLTGPASARVPEVLPPAAVPPGVAALTREVMGVMVRGKLMKAAAVVLLLGCAGLGMVLQAGQRPAATKVSPALPGSTEAPMNPPRADDVVWGKEIDGLQAGLAANARAYRHGETMKLEVNLRNVGKAEVKLTHGLLREHAPQVTATDGARMTVAMPLPLDFYAAPTHRVLKPGETITLYNPEVAVESADMLRLLGELRVDTPTMYVAAGKYRITFGGMVQSHPSLATGTVGFEVKDANPAEAFTAWGEAIGGLQAGLGFRRGDERAYHHGETVKIVLRVRNTGKDEVQFQHIWAFFVENPPTVMDADGKPVQFPRGAAEGLQMPRSTRLPPGKEVDLYEWGFDLRPKGERNPGNATIHGTGKFGLRCERIVGPTSANPNHPNPALDKLATGKLELEVSTARPAGVAARHRFTVVVNKVEPWPRVTRCAFLDNDRILVQPATPVGNGVGVPSGLEVRDAKTGKVLNSVTLDKTIIGDFRLSADRKWVAAETIADTTGTFVIPQPGVTVWDTATWKVRGTINGHRPLDLAADGRTVLVRGDDGWGGGDQAWRVEVWDVVEMKKLKTAPFEFNRIDAAALAPDGSLVAVSGLNEIAYWKWRDGDKYDRLKVGRKVDALVFSPDGKFVAEGPDTRMTVEVRDVATLKVARELSDPAQPRVPFSVAGMAFADSGKTLAFGNGVGLVESIPVPHRIHFWDVTSGMLTLQLDLKGGAPSSLDVSPDGKALATLTADGGVSLRVFDPVTGDGTGPRK
jgi:RNA polymerase sigma factor (sigma-70 family)